MTKRYLKISLVFAVLCVLTAVLMGFASTPPAETPYPILIYGWMAVGFLFLVSIFYAWQAFVIHIWMFQHTIEEAIKIGPLSLNEAYTFINYRKSCSDLFLLEIQLPRTFQKAKWMASVFVRLSRAEVMELGKLKKSNIASIKLISTSMGYRVIAIPKVAAE